MSSTPPIASPKATSPSACTSTGRRGCARSARAFNSMTARLAQQHRLRREMMADIAHELRTPLAVMQGRLEGMLDGVYPRDERQVVQVLDDTRHLSRLVEDLGTLAHTEGGTLTPAEGADRHRRPARRRGRLAAARSRCQGRCDSGNDASGSAAGRCGCRQASRGDVQFDFERAEVSSPAGQRSPLTPRSTIARSPFTYAIADQAFRRPTCRISSSAFTRAPRQPDPVSA